MNKLLYIWEYGSGLGHVAPFLPIARELTKRGWEVNFAIPAFTSGIDSIEAILEEQGFAHHKIPGSPTLVGNQSVNTHAQMIRALCGFYDSASLTFILRSWLSLLDEWKPDVVMSEYSVAGQMCARLLNIPSIICDRGYFYPEQHIGIQRFSDHKHYGPAQLSELTEQEREDELRLLEVINGARLAVGAMPLERVEDVFSADLRLELCCPELSPLWRSTRASALGSPLQSFLGKASYWREQGRKRVFAYLHAYDPSCPAILQALKSRKDLDVQAFVLSATESMFQYFNDEHLRISRELLDISSVLDGCDVVVTNGGASLIHQSLQSGVPMVLAPWNATQQMNSQRAADTGAACVMRQGFTEQQFLAYLDKALNQETLRNQAIATSKRMQPFDLEQAVGQVEQLLITSSNAQSQSAPGLAVFRPQREVSFRDYDVVFLSYDEPNADENWQHLKRIAPYAKRVHGVKGFDAAHKAAGEAAETERFILVDADNQLDPCFLDIETTIPVHLEHAVWQWCSVNHVSGLVYAFGGVKLWTKEIIAGMRTHESCEDPTNPLAIDFWNQPSYQVFEGVYSRNYTNGSPYQAFRAGYRETVKLGRLNGWLKTPQDVEQMANNPEIRRMAIWMSLGADVENGYWSLLGARVGFLSYFAENSPFTTVNEYDELEQAWEQLFAELCDESEWQPSQYGKAAVAIDTPQLRTRVEQLGDQIRALISLPPVLELAADESKAFKQQMLANVKEFPLFEPIYASKDV